MSCAHACCSHVTLTDSGMNDLFGGAFQLSEMDGINRGFVLADESGDLNKSIDAAVVQASSGNDSGDPPLF